MKMTKEERKILLTVNKMTRLTHNIMKHFLDGNLCLDTKEYLKLCKEAGFDINE